MNARQRQIELERLQRSMKRCKKCQEADYYIERPAIFSGRAIGRIMLIGQAPGVTEVKALRPFNATAGKRLFEWLAEAGIEEAEFRANHYMTSVTKCYPGKAKNGGGDRVPSREERALCRSFLDRELELVQPELIIPVGRLAINIFYDSKIPLVQIIGTQSETAGATVIPLPHPSGASIWHRMESNRILIKHALRRIATMWC